MTTPSDRYDARTLLLHWSTALLVVTLWALGQTIDWFPKGDPRTFARSTHIVLGVLLAGVLSARIQWRFGPRAVRLPPAGRGSFDQLATIVHWALYVLLVATVALGVVNTVVRGDTIFKVVRIPALFGSDKVLRQNVEHLHALAANALLCLAFFHAAAALLHHFVWKDSVLRRMLPVR